MSSGKAEKAKLLLGGCVNRIKKRNKLLKILDKSPTGWLIADEYETKDCERDSTDDEKIRKAEKAALQKRNEVQQFYRTSNGVIQRIRLLILVVVLATFAAHGCQIPVHSSLFVQPELPSSKFQCFTCGGF